MLNSLFLQIYSIIADSATFFVRGKKREEQSEINVGTRRAIALKSRENYCNLERLHNQNQPFLRVNRSFIGLHLKYVVQWLCKYMRKCLPMIDYKLVR